VIKFIIPVKNSSSFSPIKNLVEDLEKYHPSDQVVIVDSDSPDKSYMDSVKHPNLEIHDIKNKFWHPGAWWYAALNTPECENYAFMHDSMRVKDNILEIFSKELTFLMTFDINTNESFSMWSKILCEKNNKNCKLQYGCWGPILFLNKNILKSFYDMGLHEFLPCNKAETGYCEGLYGTAAEMIGFCPKEISLYGNVLFEESQLGRSGLPPHKTSWMFPIEKFYSYYHTNERL